jgi:uncharacterized protein (TIGR02466 family)
VPFSISRHPDAVRLNAALTQYVLMREASGTAANPTPHTLRNDKVFESAFNLFSEDNPAIQELRTFCWEQLLALVGHLNGYDPATLQRLRIFNECWFHIMRRGGFFGLHNHPNASWSGVYCVDPGKRDPSRKESGLLAFVNPAVGSAMHMDAGIARLQPPFGLAGATFALEPGQLVLFPSWVLHDVKPFEGEGARITIAFNCSFRLADPGQGAGASS